MGQIIILGAGTMAQEVADLIREIGQDEVLGYCVNKGKPGLSLDGKPVYWVDDLPKFLDRNIKVVRAIFSPLCYSFIKEVENMGFEFATIIHPSSSISKKAIIEPGTVINRLVAIGFNSFIGKHCLINRGCTIGHHCQLEEGVTLGPGVNIAGSVYVGKRTLIGMGSNIIQNVVVENDIRIKAGLLILK
jgi:acetyltransferase EpsM